MVRHLNATPTEQSSNYKDEAKAIVSSNKEYLHVSDLYLCHCGSGHIGMDRSSDSFLGIQK